MNKKLKSQIKPSYDTNRKRLADIIPLKTPFTVFIEPTRFCNFKCFYCLHSKKNESKREIKDTGYEIKHMDFTIYQEIIDQILLFPKTPKRIVFSGLGEPLMNTKLPEMIAYAKKNQIADRLDILTNASLLTPKLSDSLIDAGVTRIQISLQGLNSEKYREISGVTVDFEKMIDNITYLYNHKKDCNIFIKIIDCILDGKEDEEKFYKIFGDISDQIFIEHLITLQQQMGDHNGRADNTKNLNNEEVVFRHVCPVIFYMLQIDADGNVFPCPVNGLPKHFAIGDIKKENLVDIWLGKKRKNLICNHLNFNRVKMPVCGTCEACSCILDKNEYLDEEAKRLIKLFDY